MVGFASDHGLSDARSKTLDLGFHCRGNIWWCWRCSTHCSFSWQVQYMVKLACPFRGRRSISWTFGSDHEIAARGFGDLTHPVLATQFVSKSTIVCALAISQDLPLPRIVTLQLHQILSPCNIALLGPSLPYSTVLYTLLYSTLLFCSLFLSTLLYSSSLCSIILYSTLLTPLYNSIYSSTVLHPILIYY